MLESMPDLPMGLGMALLQNEQAATNFHALPARKQKEIIQRTHNISSKSEMRAMVAKLADGEIPPQLS